MGKIEATIKSEIQRLARREIRSTFLPLKRDVRAIKLKLSNLAKTLTSLDRLAKEQARQAKAEKFKLEATPEEIKISRLTPDRIRGLRKRLGMSQKDLAVLTGVSLGAVALWEKGKFRPRGDKKGALIALRKLGKRNIRKILEEKKGEMKDKGARREARRAKRKGFRGGKRSPRSKRRKR